MQLLGYRKYRSQTKDITYRAVIIKMAQISTAHIWNQKF